jgi:hypothetical protein
MNVQVDLKELVELIKKADGKISSKKVERIMALERWSDSKSDWVDIDSMNSAYIVNVIRKMANSQRASDLINDDVFKSLVLNLAKEIEKELKEEEKLEEQESSRDVYTLRTGILGRR